MFNKTQAEALQEILTKQVLNVKDKLDERRNTYLFVDKYLEKESDLTVENRQGELANKAGDKNKIRDTEIPVTHIQHQTALAYLVGLFLGGEPIFAATAPRIHEDVAAGLTALSQRDQHRLGWRGKLKNAMDYALRYNIAPVEVYWGAKRASSVKTVQPTAGSSVTGQNAPVIYEGNIIKAIDPYNFICDTTVPPEMVHEHGAFAGYVELMHYVRFKKFFHELENNYIIKHKVRECFGEAAGESLYYTPMIRKSLTSNDPDNWEGFWGTSPSIDPTGSGGKYEVVTLYARLIPKEHGLTSLPKPGHLKVFKLIYVNGRILYAEPLNTPNEFLPIIVGQFHTGGWDKKSFVEYVLDLQDLGTSMIKGTLASMRRAVADRGIYDPTRVRKSDVDSANPVAKIPVTANAYQSDIRTAYYPIPYEDRISPQFQSNLQMILALADQTTGQNQSAQGNFMRGNKTLFEFDEIMSNAQARVKLGAVTLEETLYHPLKETLKINYLIYAQAGEIENRQTGEPITIDPKLLREVAPEFKMADGILPNTKVANTEVLVQALTMMQNNPELSLEYSIPGITVSVLKQQGLQGLDQWKRTPEEQQRYAQLIGLMNGQPSQPQE